MTSRLRLVAGAASAVVLLAGCSGGSADDGAAGSAAPTSSAATSALPAATTPPAADPAPSGDDVTADGVPDPTPFPASAGDVSQAAVTGEGPSVVTGVRIGSQPGFGRVVLDLSGTTLPGWDVGWVDQLRDGQTGQEVALPGQAVLRVALTGVSDPDGFGDAVEATRGSYLTEAGPVLGVYYAARQGDGSEGPASGQVVAYVAADTERPFRVYALQDPTRVVVELEG